MDTTLPPIPQLNDDCLMIIFDQLDVCEQLRFALTCQRFRDIFLNRYKFPKDHELDAAAIDVMSYEEIPEFFKLVGPSVERIELNKFCDIEPEYFVDDIIRYIAQFCPNTKSLTLNGYDADIESISEKDLLGILKNMKALDTVHVIFPLFERSAMDNILRALTQLGNLENLSLQGCQLSGQHLCDMTNLKELILFNSGYILEEPHLIETFKSLKELKLLDVRLCKPKPMSQVAIDELASNCQKLEELYMDNCTDEHATALGRLTNLRGISLEIVAFTDAGLSRLGTLVNLTKISLHRCKGITNDGLLHLFRCCTQLEYLNLDGCDNITETFVLDAIEVIKQRQIEHTVQFKVSQTKINMRILKNPRYLEAASLLKLEFNEFNAMEEEDP